MKTTIVAIAMSMAASAMTFSDLQQAVSAAQDGATVYVENDIEYDGELVFPAGNVTLASAPGVTNTLTRAASYSGTFIRANASGVNATIRDLVIDGNKAHGSYTAFPLNISGGNVTLASGGMIRNFKGNAGGSGAGAVCVTGGGNFTMENGSEISGCEASSWGVAVQVNNANSHFYMYGGAITGCVDTTTGGPGGGYGGIVYIYNGQVVMTNGVITGNSSAKSVGGVLAYNGGLLISGSACITNNVGGGGNDVYLTKSQYGNGHMIVETWRGPFTGHVTVHVSEKPENGANVYPKLNTWCSQYYPSLGLGGIVCEQWPEYVMDGSVLINEYYPVWCLRAEIKERGLSGNFNDLAAQLQDGDTLELDGDVQATYAVTNSGNGAKATIKGNGHRITAKTSGFCFLARDGATLRLEDVVLDGGSTSVPLLYAAAGSRLEIGNGTVVENVRNSKSPSFARIVGAGAVMTMEAGAVIRNCRATSVQAWGGICVGNGTTYSPAPRFEMSGGYITNNVMCSQEAPNPDGYGGIVYCYKGHFEMSGGTIAHNACTNAVSGVNVYDGSITISGTARVENNLPGHHPDVYKRSGSGKLVGDFRGHVGISSGAQNSDGAVGFNYENVTSGACRIFSASNAKYGQLSSYVWPAESNLYFYTAADWIGGIGCPQKGAKYYLTESVASLVPESIDANVDELPVVFKGVRALALSGTIPVTFDPEDFAGYDKHEDYAVTLLHAEGGVFAGSWSFALPEELRKKRWGVRCENGGSDYVLYYNSRRGAVLLFK